MPPFGGFGISTGSLVSGLVNNVAGSAANAIFPKGLFGGFGTSAGSLLNGQKPNTPKSAADRRVSLRPKPGGANTILGKGLLDPLRGTNNGMIWPYTPSIQYTQAINYQAIQMVHANQDFQIYSNTPGTELAVDGTFTVQNQQEGAYAMACIHFLRTMSKMNFGESDPNAGTPPPVLLFNAYGPFVFKDLPVIVKSFTIGFPDDVDYVQVTVVGSKGTGTTAAAAAKSSSTPAKTIDRRVLTENLPPVKGANVSNDYNIYNYNLAGTPGMSGSVETLSQGVAGKLSSGGPAKTAGQSYTVWLPSQFKISANLVVQHTPKVLRSTFNLPSYRNGDPSQQSFI